MPIYKYKNSKGQVMYYLKVSYKGKQYMKRGFASKKMPENMSLIL